MVSIAREKQYTGRKSKRMYLNYKKTIKCNFFLAIWERYVIIIKIKCGAVFRHLQIERKGEGVT